MESEKKLALSEIEGPRYLQKGRNMSKKIITIVAFLAVILSAQTVSSVFGAEVQAPQPRSRSEVQAVLAKAPKPAKRDLRQLDIVLVAFKKDHGLNEHDYPLWQKRWAVLLGGQEAGQEKQVNLYGPAPKKQREKVLAGAPNVRVSTADGWPSKEQFKTAELIVAFCYIQWDGQKMQELEEFLSRGGGFVLLHPAVIVPQGMDITDQLAKLIGLAWEYNYTRWRHGEVALKITAQEHPICLGLPDTIHLLDEAYWPLKGDRSKVTVLATSDEAVSPAPSTGSGQALSQVEGKDSEQTKPEPMFYAYQSGPWHGLPARENTAKMAVPPSQDAAAGKGRVFSCILGHYTWTFDDPYFRILLLRGMAWAAGESPYRFDQLVTRGALIGKGR